MGGLAGTVDVASLSPAGAALPRRRVPLAETAPGHYEGALDLDAGVAALLFRASLATPDGLPAADASGHLSLPVAPELRPASDAADPLSGPGLLAAATARTGGAILTGPLDLLAPGGPRPEVRRSLRTPVLLAGLALFLLDVLLRRISPDALARLRRGNV
jgi:hypothetical protein